MREERGEGRKERSTERLLTGKISDEQWREAMREKIRQAQLVREEVKVEDKMKTIMERRGVFRVAREVIEWAPEEVLRLMGQVIVVRAECLYASQRVEYEAYSLHFAPVEPYNAPGGYIFALDEGGKLKVIRWESWEQFERSGTLRYFDQRFNWWEYKKWQEANPHHHGIPDLADIGPPVVTDFRVETFPAEGGLSVDGLAQFVDPPTDYISAGEEEVTASTAANGPGVVESLAEGERDDADGIAERIFLKGMRYDLS